MGGVAPLVWLACALGVAAVALLRLAWARRRRSARLTGSAWAALAVAVILAWRGEGAWGVAILSMFAMAAALVALAVAGARSPRGREKASDRRAGMLPEAGEPRRIGSRIATFLLVIFGGLVASVGLAIVARGLGILLGWSEADANALAFFALPLAWAALAAILLIQPRRRSQVATLLACALLALPFLASGGA